MLFSRSNLHNNPCSVPASWANTRQEFAYHEQKLFERGRWLEVRFFEVSQLELWQEFVGASNDTIGLRSLVQSALGFFGMRAIKEAPKFFDSLPLEWNSFMKAIMLSLKSTQKRWKKSIGYPALFPPTSKTACLISFSNPLFSHYTLSSHIACELQLVWKRLLPHLFGVWTWRNLQCTWLNHQGVQFLNLHLSENIFCYICF